MVYSINEVSKHLANSIWATLRILYGYTDTGSTVDRPPCSTMRRQQCNQPARCRKGKRARQAHGSATYCVRMMRTGQATDRVRDLRMDTTREAGYLDVLYSRWAYLLGMLLRWCSSTSRIAALNTMHDPGYSGWGRKSCWGTWVGGGWVGATPITCCASGTLLSQSPSQPCC
jgi:hypothetical protein